MRSAHLGPAAFARRARYAAVPLAVAAAVCAGCGSSGSSGSTATTAATATPAAQASAPPSPSATPSASPSASASAGGSAGTAAAKGFDDINGDGTPDPTCGTQDFGAGLVLRIPCNLAGYAHQPEDGTTLVPNSLYRLPNPGDLDLPGVSGELIGGRDPHGGKVEIIIYNSDELFATGSAAVNSVDVLDNTIKIVDERWPGSALQVRGHTDDTGSPAANQTLSEQRAAAVRAYLLGHGIKATSVSAVGLGQGHPLVRNDTDQGRAFNRRVELVIRVPDA